MPLNHVHNVKTIFERKQSAEHIRLVPASQIYRPKIINGNFNLSAFSLLLDPALKQGNSGSGKKVRIHYLHWLMQFIFVLGKVGDKATENEVLLLEHDIPHSSFSEAVLECLPILPWEITRKVFGTDSSPTSGLTLPSLILSGPPGPLEGYRKIGYCRHGVKISS